MGTCIHRFPEEIGSLRFLQTLNLEGCGIIETPSLITSFPKQLVCLSISFKGHTSADAELGWLERLTSLEELFMDRSGRRFEWKELGALRKLGALTLHVHMDDKESERDFVESVRRLGMLKSLLVYNNNNYSTIRFQAAGLIHSRQLRELVVYDVTFLKLPPCINPSGLPSLSHLSLKLEDVDELDLQNLGGLPELRFLNLDLLEGCSAAVSCNVNDSSVVYFPKLRCFKLYGATVLFLASKEDNKVSFHL